MSLAALIGNHSLEELASVGTVETFLTEITGISHPLTFTGTDVNSYRVSDMTGAQFTVADTGVVICNNRVIIVDGVVLPATTYYGLPLVSASQFNAALYRNSYSLAPAPAPTLANRAPAQAPAPLPLSQQLRGKLRF